MWKIIIVIIIVAIVDLRKVVMKEKKKEVFIYFILCLITLSLGLYSINPNHVTLTEFVLKLNP